MSQDTLSEVLRSVRLRGAIFFYVEGAAPWVAETPAAHTLAPMIMPEAEHLMEYHVVTRGACWAGLVGEPPVRLGEGDIIVFPHGDAHVVSSAPGMRAPALDESFFSPRPAQLPYVLSEGGGARDTVVLEGSGERTRVVCGFLGCDARPYNPLLAALPRMLHLAAGEAGQDGMIRHFICLAVEESNRKRPGGEAVLGRLSEMMFVDVVRRHLEALPESQRGWLAGLRDRQVGRALALLHDRPDHDWTIDALADRVGLSRSALHERFAQFIGQPPMQYLAHWRMQVASGLLTETQANVAAVALEVGYESEAAFCRAFKRATGMPPAAWRRERTAARRLAQSAASPPH